MHCIFCELYLTVITLPDTWWHQINGVVDCYSNTKLVYKNSWWAIFIDPEITICWNHSYIIQPKSCTHTATTVQCEYISLPHDIERFPILVVSKYRLFGRKKAKNNLCSQFPCCDNSVLPSQKKKSYSTFLDLCNSRDIVRRRTENGAEEIGCEKLR